MVAHWRAEYDPLRFKFWWVIRFSSLFHDFENTKKHLFLYLTKLKIYHLPYSCLHSWRIRHYWSQQYAGRVSPMKWPSCSLWLSGRVVVEHRSTEFDLLRFDSSPGLKICPLFHNFDMIKRHFPSSNTTALITAKHSSFFKEVETFEWPFSICCSLSLMMTQMIERSLFYKTTSNNNILYKNFLPRFFLWFWMSVRGLQADVTYSSFLLKIFRLHKSDLHISDWVKH